MKSSKLLTWLDIRRIVREKTDSGTRLPEGVVRISCFSDALELGVIDDNSIRHAKDALKLWFGARYQTETSVIQLDIGEAVLPVEFCAHESRSEGHIPTRPFWEEIAYTETRGKNFRMPKPCPSEGPDLIAFYSFKGGVGRTLHLSAYLFAVLERARKFGLTKTILVIDADLGSPGLTYWNRFDKQQPAVSFIDFMEVYHYSPLSDTGKTLSLFADEIKKASKYEGRSVWYVLPAFLNNSELLDTDVLPEHLVRNSYDPWGYGNALFALGQAVGADFILLDIQAGLSETSAPVIFDPRIRRFIITTLAPQSVQGTLMILEHISRVGGSGIYPDPSVVISMLKPEFRSLPEFETTLTRFRNSYTDTGAKHLDILETDFDEELLYVKNWEDARLKLAGTSVMKIAREWAENRLMSEDAEHLTPEDVSEYSETEEGEALLVTQ